MLTVGLRHRRARAPASPERSEPVAEDWVSPEVARAWEERVIPDRLYSEAVIESMQVVHVVDQPWADVDDWFPALCGFRLRVVGEDATLEPAGHDFFEAARRLPADRISCAECRSRWERSLERSGAEEAGSPIKA